MSNRTSLLFVGAHSVKLTWLIFPLLLSACSAPMGQLTAEQRTEPVVTYGRYGDFRRSYEVKVYADRSVAYSGVQGVKIIGERRFEISEEKYKQLLRKFTESNFSNLMPEYGSAIMSGYHSLSITLKTGEKSKTVRGATSPQMWPKNLIELMRAIEDTLELEKLTCPAEVKTANGSIVEVCAAAREYEQRALREVK